VHTNTQVEHIVQEPLEKDIDLELIKHERNAQQHACQLHTTELQIQKERVYALEKQLQAEIQARKKAEHEYADLLEKYKEIKPKNKKIPA
jgi:hypothetical protein